MAYAHQVSILERMVSEATIVNGFRAAMGDEDATTPDFFGLKAELDEWLLSRPEPAGPLSELDTTTQADRKSLGLEAR